MYSKTFRQEAEVVLEDAFAVCDKLQDFIFRHCRLHAGCEPIKIIFNILIGFINHG